MVGVGSYQIYLDTLYKALFWNFSWVSPSVSLSDISFFSYLADFFCSLAQLSWKSSVIQTNDVRFSLCFLATAFHFPFEQLFHSKATESFKLLYITSKGIFCSRAYTHPPTLTHTQTSVQWCFVSAREARTTNCKRRTGNGVCKRISGHKRTESRANRSKIEQAKYSEKQDDGCREKKNYMRGEKAKGRERGSNRVTRERK